MCILDFARTFALDSPLETFETFGNADLHNIHSVMHSSACTSLAQCPIETVIALGYLVDYGPLYIQHYA